MKKLCKNEFIKKANEKFSDKYDYTSFDYFDMKTKSCIICPLHGQFFQTPESHLRNKSQGCPNCAKLYISEKNKTRDYSKRIKETMSIEMFLQRCQEKYNDKFIINLKNFNGVCGRKIEVMCPIHGLFEVHPKNFLNENNKTGCVLCGREMASKNRRISYIDILDKFKDIHKNKYFYPDINNKKYIKKTSIVDIVCPKHGNFSLSAQKHSEGRGCHKCLIEYNISNGIFVGGYSEQFFIDNPSLKETPAKIYYLKIQNTKYYKIGISKSSIQNRVKHLKCSAKKYGEIINPLILLIKDTNLYDAFMKEQKILNHYKYHRVYKKWSTELFSVDLSNEPLLLEIFG
jgi:hypothetical protein